ncbi:hypothetical protein OIE66_33980 [Nonomuraea sp. NBC_01738]|uniref:hypothetical protein n=1 Tax=Nonomuraea sp. NBC_01738 TaxID=2976003 RepID=UPI002E0EE6A4|nr:hypothetical protein OIE66_33980 [Nonomuraea sp. NBC_01738]
MKVRLVLAALLLTACSAPVEAGPRPFAPTPSPVRWITESGIARLASGPSMTLGNVAEVVAVSHDGHRVAYIDGTTGQYAALDLRTGQVRQLTARPAGRVNEPHLAISGDGAYFAASPADIAETTVTTFDTGETRVVKQLCRVYGVSASGVLGTRDCEGDSDLRWVAPGKKPRVFEYLDRNDDPSLSPDGAFISVNGFTLVDFTTGETVRNFPIPATQQWLDAGHLLARTGNGYYAADIRTGSLTKLAVDAPPHETVLIGRWRP